MSRHKNPYKQDPDYHDIRAKVLLETAQHFDNLAKEARETYKSITRDLQGPDHDSDSYRALDGYTEAAAELRRMASNARRAHKKVLDVRRDQAAASDAKWKAFTGE